MIYLLIILLSSFTIQSQSTPAISDDVLRSDIIYKHFVNEIRDIINLSDISSLAKNEFNSTKCYRSLSSIILQMPSQNVLPFIDSWGRIPSGILKLHLVSLGNFDQCVDISVELNEDIGIVNGQYCLASIGLKLGHNPATSNQNNTSSNLDNNMVNNLKLSIGICVPDSCTSEMLSTLFQNAVNESLAEISVSQCKVAKKSDLDPSELVGIIILSMFGAFVVLSSSYDLLMRYLKRSPCIFVLAFSIFTNGKKLFAINTEKSPNTIECLGGIRVLSMVWVLYSHNYGFTTLLPLINTADINQWFQKAWSLHVINATVSVDSFLLMSGLLIAWLGFQELDRKNGKLNVLMMYVHRYIRLTPPVAGVIIFFISIYKLVLVGPNDSALLALNGQCSKHWWVTLLYIQNYLWSDEECMPQTWYLAVDFQLYIVSPLLLIPMWKWGKKFSPVLVILAVLSIGWVIGIFFSEGYNNFVDISSIERMRKVYFPTHTRYSPWLVGLGLGYFMHVNRQRVFKPSKTIQSLAWVLCLGTMLAIIFGTYFTINSNRSITIIETALYESLKRISWSMAVAWIVFACHFGFGGVISSFLAHPFWQPLSRLTYSLYLVHLAIIGINFGTIRTESYFSEYNEVLLFWSTFGMSFIAALTLTLTFEAPIIVLEKAIVGKMGSKQQEDDANLDTPVIPQNKIEAGHKISTHT